MTLFTSYDWIFWLTVAYAMIPILLLIKDERESELGQNSRK